MNTEWFLSSCAMILLVIFVRFMFRNRIRPHVRYALWLMVALRLLIPVSFPETPLSVRNLLPERTVEEADAVGQTVVEKSMAAGKDTAADAGTDAVTGVETGMKAGEAVEIEIIEETATAVRSGLPASYPIISQESIIRFCKFCRLLGSVACAVTLVAVNVSYYSRLKRSRKKVPAGILPIDSAVSVYDAEMIQSPCLFGVLHPAIYVTKSVMEEKQSFIFVLCHENTHYKHRDNWWTLLRMLCVCLHWYNPLVWLAAYLSRQDGELACDEKVIETLGKDVRADYGRTLLKMSEMKTSGVGGWHMSTAMRGSKRRLKERLQMIMHVPEKSPGMQALLSFCVILVLAVTFTGTDSYAAQEAGTWDFADMKERQILQAVGGIAPDLEQQGLSVRNKNGNEDGNIAGVGEENELRGTIYYQIDEEGRQHMVRYVEEYLSEDAAPGRLELYYVEDDNMYTLPAIADDENLPVTLVAMAKQALSDLEKWTGEKVDTAYFQVSDMGGVVFGRSREDIEHSRIFYSRYYGADTGYNLSGYGQSISSFDIMSARAVWYSPVSWHVFPEDIQRMTDEEAVIWYVERSPALAGDIIKSIEQRYEDVWTIQTQSGKWYEVIYNKNLREISGITGPYPDYPQH